MASDGVEDLRQRVDELEATVRGLTQELVEAKERVRELEGEEASDAGANKPIPDERQGETTGDESPDGDEEADTEADDIIVA